MKQRALLRSQAHPLRLAGPIIEARLPATVRQFMTLDLLPSCSLSQEAIIGREELTARMAYELSGFEQQIAAPLRPCLALLFPAQKSLQRDARSVPAVDLLTLKLAIQHAQRNASSFTV